MKFVKRSKKGKCDTSRCKATSQYRADIEDKKRALCEEHAKAAMAEYGIDPTAFVFIEEEGDEGEAEDTKTPQERAHALVEQETEEAQATLQVLETFHIRTRQDFENTAQVLAEVKGRYKRLDAEEKAITQPMRVSLEGVRKLFRKPKAALGQIEAILKRKIADWENEERAREAAAMKAAAEAHAAGDAAGTQLAMSQIGGAADVDGLSTYVKFKPLVIDPSQVPREYLVVDVSAIAKLATGVKQAEALPQIPGIQWEAETVVRSRSA